MSYHSADLFHRPKDVFSAEAALLSLSFRSHPPLSSIFYWRIIFQGQDSALLTVKWGIQALWHCVVMSANSSLILYEKFSLYNKTIRILGIIIWPCTKKALYNQRFSSKDIYLTPITDLIQLVWERLSKDGRLLKRFVWHFGKCAYPHLSCLCSSVGRITLKMSSNSNYLFKKM